jgi:phosphoserine phosphatase RsbX
MASLSEPTPDHRPAGWLDWSVGTKPLEPGVSGDGYVVEEGPHGALIAVVDGLGHGRDAAAATARAIAVLEAHADEPVVPLVRRCHQALRGTRGVALSLVSVDPARSVLSWVGVGNVETLLVRRGETTPRVRERMVLRGGVVGYQLPFLLARDVPIQAADVIAMATDGLGGAFADAVAPGAVPAYSAAHLLATYAKENDDALVLVARYRGVSA